MRGRVAVQYRFGSFELDTRTGELRRAGLRVRLHAQPLELLGLLLREPGTMVAREEIVRALWPDGTFVDFDHGVHSAVNRLREALGDRAREPRYVETVARRGYRFVAPVTMVAEPGEATASPAPAGSPDPDPDPMPEPGPVPVADAGLDGISPGAPNAPAAAPLPNAAIPGWQRAVLARPEDLPAVPPGLVRTLFLLLQGMYLVFYVAALGNLREVAELLAQWGAGFGTVAAVAGTALLLIPVRLFLGCAELFRAPQFLRQFLRLWPFLLVADTAWALAPLLLLHHVPMGLALAAVAALLYAPLAQRSLVLMRR